jgi:hypothetical protein
MAANPLAKFFAASTAAPVATTAAAMPPVQRLLRVALRSATGGLDVEEISLVGPSTGAEVGQQHQ